MSNFKPEFITASDMATRLNITRQTICNLIKEGKIKAIKVGKSWRISIKEAERIENEGVEVIDLDEIERDLYDENGINKETGEYNVEFDAFYPDFSALDKALKEIKEDGSK